MPTLESLPGRWTMGKVARPYKTTLIDNLLHAPGRLRLAIGGLSDADMDAAPVPGKWTTRACVEHIVMADLGWSDIYSEAVRPHHVELPPHAPGWSAALIARAKSGTDAALAVMEENHAAVIADLCKLPEEAFDHEHPPVQWLVQAKIPFVIKESINWGLCVHVDHHLIAIHEKRVALGKPLAWMADIRTE